MLGLAYRSTINVLTTMLLASIVAVAGLIAAHGHFARDLPDYHNLAAYEPPIVSRVYAADGVLLADFASERRIFMPYAAIPKRVIDAFVAAEDQRFFSHPGIDVIGVARVLTSYLTGTGVRRLQGASTITQQVAKNFLLTPERSFDRKVKEMILSFRIERAYTKERILELYLNQIFLGQRAFGVAAASLAYFDKALSELSVAEAAFLGALPQAPSRFNPRRNATEMIARRNYVVQRMRDELYITAAEAEIAKAAPLGVKIAAAPASVGAEYFVDEIRRDLLARHGPEKTVAGGYVIRSTLEPKLQAFADRALRHGLVAYDRRHGWRGPVTNFKSGKGERWADNWRQRLRALPRPPGHGDWLLVLVLDVTDAGAEVSTFDSRRGRIPLAELLWARRQGDSRVEPGKPALKTAVGPPIRKAGDVLAIGDVILVEQIATDERNRPYPTDTYALRQIPEVNGALVAMDPHTGRVLAMSGGFSFWLSQYNTATQAWRQPGSSFKTYVYLAALEQGFTPATIIMDAPIAIKTGVTVYRPRNSTGKFYGLTPLRTGIEQSRNLATLRLAEATGYAHIADLATKLGVSDNLEPLPTMALGAFETTAMRQVAAYSMIVNGGRRIQPTLVDRIQDRYGKTIYRHDSRRCAECASLAVTGIPRLIDDREQVIDEDYAFQIVSMLQGAVQRGTGAALIALNRPVGGKTGTTNDVLDAWFVGITPDLVVAVWVGFDRPRTLGPAEQGAITAAPIARDFFKAALADVPVRDFTKPKGIVTVTSGAGAEHYKRGFEPGTGKGRLLDSAAVAKPGHLPEIGNGTDMTY